jgi:RNA polymerase sigma-B factor
MAPAVTDRRPNGEERELLARYHLEGDIAARQQLIERFLPLARKIVRTFERPGESTDDLMQVASIGLVKAVDRFELERGTAFSSFAVPTIVGELKRYLRDSGWDVHVPRATQERALRVSQALGDLSHTLGRSPTPKEIAEATGLEHEEVLEGMEAGMAYDSLSLDMPGTDEPDGPSYAERIAVDEGGYELAEYSATIGPKLRALPPRDRLVLQLRFVEDLTQSEIAERIGVSQMHVSRLIRQALERLRDGIEG